MTSTWPSLLALALLFIGLPVALWLLRRTPGSLATGRHAALTVVAAIAVGARERIAIVRAGPRWLVVGITGHTITTLAELDEAPGAPDQMAAASIHAGTGQFGQLLRSWSVRAGQRRP